MENSMPQNNPLKQYFRQPSIYIRLPSEGNFYPPGSVNLPPNGEIPVYPMTAIDEIRYRTPDALFNGQAVVDVIRSCCPNIRDPWQMPNVDVDTVLIAIRLASYGHQMDFGTRCPHCNAMSDRAIDLRTVLEQMRSPDYTQPIQHGDIQIILKPMTYKNMNDNNRIQFDEQKLSQVITNEGVDEATKFKALSEAMKKITEVTVDALSQSIAAIKTPSAFVNEANFIREFLQNCERNLFNQIRDQIIKIKQDSELKPLTLECDECHQQYQQSITLDMANFFADAS